ncbi:MAG: ribonuclease P protein component [Candidatus Portnoybacteria bacterium]|nr:ribonuclease P protein component [Candidatus Portnoybacteria bacterium]
MLPKIQRLRKAGDFKTALKSGRFVRGELMDIRFSANDLGICRFGFIISAKVSKKAVLRNRARRQISQAAKALIGYIRPGYDFVIIAKPKIIGKDSGEINQKLNDFFKKTNLFSQ